jgi:hypothetical protein
MKTISIGRVDCDIIISDNNISRKHATISLVNGQYVYNDISKNGTTINGRVYQNEKVVVTPGTPIYLANKVPLPWPQILMLLPNSPIKIQGSTSSQNVVNIESPVKEQESIGIAAGALSFLFPIVGFILYFVWKNTSHNKAKQAANIAWISIAISFVIGFIGAISM